MWELPAKNESTDISHLKFQLDDEPPVILMSNSTDIILPLSYGQHNASIVAVDRCNRTSDSSVLQVDVQKGE